MRRINRYIIVFAFIFFVFMLSSCERPIENSDDVWFVFDLNSDKTGYYVKYSNVTGKEPDGKNSMVDVIIPSEYDGLPVVGIYMDAFRDSKIMKSVQLPESMEHISTNAFFGCSNLESIHIPKNLTKGIGGDVFGQCSSLQSITVDSKNDSYCSIDGNLYSKDGSRLIVYAAGKKETSFNIPDGVESICSYAFYHSDNLKSISIPASVTEFSYDGILCCDVIEGVAVDENNSVYRSIEGNLYSKDGKTFLRLCNSTSNLNLIIPEGVTSIERYAAYYYNNIASVTIPGSVTYISPEAFSCSNFAEAYFVNPLGWKATPKGSWFQSTKYFSESELTSPTTAATFLLEYSNSEWRRED